MESISSLCLLLYTSLCEIPFAGWLIPEITAAPDLSPNVLALRQGKYVYINCRELQELSHAESMQDPSESDNDWELCKWKCSGYSQIALQPASPYLPVLLSEPSEALPMCNPTPLSHYCASAHKDLYCKVLSYGSKERLALCRNDCCQLWTPYIYPSHLMCRA